MAENKLPLGWGEDNNELPAAWGENTNKTMFIENQQKPTKLEYHEPIQNIENNLDAVSCFEDFQYTSLVTDTIESTQDNLSINIEYEKEPTPEDNTFINSKQKSTTIATKNSAKAHKGIFIDVLCGGVIGLLVLAFVFMGLPFIKNKLNSENKDGDISNTDTISVTSTTIARTSEFEVTTESIIPKKCNR